MMNRVNEESRAPAEAPRERAATRSPSLLSGWWRRCARVLLLAALTLGVLPNVASAQGARYEGPLDVQRTFFKAIVDGDYRKATTTFEDGVFASEFLAIEAAKDFYEVFRRTRAISLKTELPATSEQDFTLSLAPPDHPQFVVEVVYRKTSNGFRFARETLLQIDAWREMLAGVAPAREVEEARGALEALRFRLRSSLGPGMTSTAFLIENWQWLGLLLLTLIAVITDRIVRLVSGRITARISGREDIALDEETLKSFERPLGLLFAVVVFELLLPVLGIDREVLRILTLATSLIAAVAGVFAAYRLVDVLCDFLGERAAKTENKFDDMLVPLARRTLKVFVAIVGLLFVASRLSNDFWGIVAGLGLGSLAIGFAARDSIENLFGTFTVLLDKPFQIGDWVIVGELEGSVETVGIRSTKIRTFYNSLITVPNREFIASAIDNMGERRYRRIRTTLGVTYDTPPEKVEAFCEGIRELIRSHPYTRKDYYHVYLNGFGASSLDVMLYCFVETPEWATELREKHRLFADILRLANELGVSFAFPTQTLHVAKPEDLVHTDTPPDDVAADERGRAAASRVAAKTLQPFGGLGSIPPPVEIATKPFYGSDDAGGDGGN